MTKRTRLLLSRKAFKENVDAINRFTGHPSLALVVKSNAYGHGMYEIASLADVHHGVSWICTAGISEALSLRHKGITKPLLVLSYLDGDLEETIRRGIHLCISSQDEAHAVAAAAQKARVQAYIHIKIDTGMGRMGLLDTVVEQVHTMSQLPHIKVYGAFTHLSDTGHEDTSYCEMQLERFDEVLDELEAAGVKLACTHAQSSSSLNFKPRRAYSFIRAGAAAYGLWKSPKQKEIMQSLDPSFDLTPVGEWRARVTQIKELPEGSYVGYQRTFKTMRLTTLALVPIGYWDGYPHALSNKGVALLHGQYAPVAGVISMNIAVFDVTDIPAKVGDELILLGNAPSIAPHEVARAAGCITNEITTAVHSSIERSIVEYHAPLSISFQSQPADTVLAER